eukprot:3449990-Amphidinium_carterae.2
MTWTTFLPSCAVAENTFEHRAFAAESTGLLLTSHDSTNQDSTVKNNPSKSRRHKVAELSSVDAETWHSQTRLIRKHQRRMPGDGIIGSLLPPPDPETPDNPDSVNSKGPKKSHQATEVQKVLLLWVEGWGDSKAHQLRM